MTPLARLLLIALPCVLVTTGCGTDPEGSAPDAGVPIVDAPDAPEAADPGASDVQTPPPTDTLPPEDLAEDAGEPEDTAAPDALEPVDNAAEPELPDENEDLPPEEELPPPPPDADEPFLCPAPRPVLLVHGVNGSSADFDVMVERLIDDGWPEELVFVFDAADPSWGCNLDNAKAIASLVDEIQTTTGHDRIDLVAHSMGTLSTRYFVKNLGGAELVNTYVTLGGPHHGLASPCWAPDFLGVCVWQELCETGEYVTQLNADPATPGELNWVSMYGTADASIPNASSILDGAENIAFEGVEHFGPNGLLEVLDVYAEVKRVLEYPCWVAP